MCKVLPFLRSYPLFLQQHHHFEEEDVVHRHLLVFVQDLERFAADGIILDQSRKCQIRS